MAGVFVLPEPVLWVSLLAMLTPGGGGEEGGGGGQRG